MGLGSFLRSLRRLESSAGSDAELLAAFAGRRDERAFAALVARHGPMVLERLSVDADQMPELENALKGLP